MGKVNNVDEEGFTNEVIINLDVFGVLMENKISCYTNSSDVVSGVAFSCTYPSSERSRCSH